jgi:hypothetical protein
MLPGAIAVSTVFLFLADSSGTHHWYGVVNRTPARICFFGAVFGCAFCVVLAVVACRRFVRASSACPGPYTELRRGFDDLWDRVGCACEGACVPDVGAACREADDHLTYLDEQVFAKPAQSGVPWLLGTGYIDAWRRLHAAEEAVLLVEPVPRVVGQALDDELRLDGSTIPQNAALLKRLRLAVTTLDEAAAGYLVEAPQSASGSNPANSPDAATARTALVHVRRAINDFRDSRREALVRARNRLYATVIFAGLTGCLLLFVAILSGPLPKPSIVAASAFYGVGALVGLVKLLQSASRGASVSQEDYGLGVVRLIHTPLLSGLAAIGGVVLVKLTQGQGQTFSLQETFRLDKNPYGLVAAAFFGLTPSLLLSGLQQRVEQYRTDLSRSDASESQTS